LALYQVSYLYLFLVGVHGLYSCRYVDTCNYTVRARRPEKGKASSLDIAPITILNSGTLQPRKWQLTGNDCSTAAHAVAAQSPL